MSKQSHQFMTINQYYEELKEPVQGHYMVQVYVGIEPRTSHY